jgi:hypothetical protein
MIKNRYADFGDWHRLCRNMMITRIIGSAWFMSLSAVTAGCFIPSNHEQQPQLDSGSSRPIIDRRKVNPSTWEFTWQQKAAARPFQVRVIDADKQTMHGRLFVDYNYKAWVDKSTVQDQGEYTLGFFVEGLCDEVVNNEPGKHNVTVVVSDSGFVNIGSDLSVILEGGGRDEVNWTVNCQAVSGDGGI